MKNYYQILEISENASSEIIEKSYRVLAKKYHPDVWPKDKLYLAEIKFREITEAYKILSNPVSKYNYDIQLANYLSLSNQNYYNMQNNINSNNEKNNSSEEKNTKKKRNLIPNYIPHFKSLFSDLKSFLENQSNQPKEERLKHKKALILTFIIVFVIILLFIKVPFLNKFIFP